MYRWSALPGFWLLLSLVGCVPAPYLYAPPEVLDDGLSIATLKDEKMESKPLVAMMDAMRANKYRNIHSVLILRHSKLVLEEYAHGYLRSDWHDLRSSTKSITALLIGIGLQKGWIKDENLTVASFFADDPKVKAWSAQKKLITLRHLLTMSSGLDCDDHQPNSPGNEEWMYKTHDWVKFVLELPSVRPPGQKFAYCTGGVVLLGAILQKASGLKIPDLAKHYLFDPLGIKKVKWSFMPSGQTDTGGHIYLTPRAMAKIGLLMLQGGLWKGTQVISKSWLQRIASSQIQDPKKQVDYGFLWWRKKARNSQTGKILDIVHTSGNGGQYIFVVPSLDLVMVFTGGNYNSKLMQQPFQMMGSVFQSIQSFSSP